MEPRSALSLLLLLALCGCDRFSRSAGTPPSREHASAPASVSAEPSSAPLSLAEASRAEIELLRRHGWTPVRLLAEDTLQLPEPVTQYLQTKRYLEASQMIGLDFSSLAGQRLRVLTYGVQGHEVPRGSVRAHLLYRESEILGAWLSVEDRTPGIYSLDVNPYSL